MSASAQVRFFFDTPEHCGLSAGGNADLAHRQQPHRLDQQSRDCRRFYLLGSTTIPTSVSLGGNANTEDEFVIYGPNTTINIVGNATYKGVMAGKKIVVTGNGKVENDSAYRPPAEITPVTEIGKPKEKEKTSGGTTKKTITTARYYSPQFYVECTGTAAAGRRAERQLLSAAPGAGIGSQRSS